MSQLVQHNNALLREVIELRDVVRKRREEKTVPHASDYPLAQLKERITQALRERSGRDDVAWEIDFLDRTKFGADFAVRLIDLLKENGAKEYIQSHVPWIAEALASPQLGDLVAEVSKKGIYVNVKLRDRWFLDSVQSVVDFGDDYGHNDAWSGRTQIVDYSSPNAAKVLHAGHLRSTMIGHVLCNLYESCGALVYRVNHINDFGGFGFILEGYRRFGEHFPAGLTDNEQLLEVYAIRRVLERVATEGEGPADDREREIIARYLPEADTPAAVRAAYDDFVAASDERFRRLEEGDAEEVDLWLRMVRWSLADFQSFYRALGIHIDFVIGESVYVTAGNEVVDEAIEAGTAYILTPEMVTAQVAEIDRALAAEEITTQARDRSVAMLEKDVGAVVVPLPGGERLVARRRDGRSIYATRDLGAIKVRRDVFDPTDITYVVGQEQQVHFSRLFEAANVLGIASPGKPRFKHIYFGFYVDAESGRKLSSRESVAGVTDLLSGAVKHFRERSAERGTMTEEELDTAAQQLAVGSVVFNDLKRDMKGPVSMKRGDITPMLLEFEKSGGPYVVYSACRARSILRKYGRALPEAAQIDDFEINDQEAQLIAKIVEFPEKVIRAADEDNPSILLRYLLDLAGAYNPYYAAAPVLEGEKANESRLLITAAIQTTLINGLALCHVECPPKI